MRKTDGRCRHSFKTACEHASSATVDGVSFVFTDDDQKDAALDTVRPLPELNHDDRGGDDLDDRICAVVREELERDQ